jgi:hypothetical protein
MRKIVLAVVIALACPVGAGIAADLKALPGIKQPPVQRPTIERLPGLGAVKPSDRILPAAPRTIAVPTPLTAEGARPTSSGTIFPLKTIGVQTSLSAIGARVAPSGVQFPMKTLSVPTSIEATGPR